ncbi:MAG: neutral/alkaline non-lysosomal ceramidase N-terminal domain-containing protein [Planctomycetaceae bacterium]|nr:neutral/alkaline non-lysosomal ceramidase N-terminal domain-containing protein [Planctomycetaceae bacterium]
MRLSPSRRHSVASLTAARICLVAAAIFSMTVSARLVAQDAEKPSAESKIRSRAYLDESNPWYPHKDFPKLITPQWVGEEGVEAVIVLAIDDMRDPAKYEAYLRPILNRLKQIDGRAPVSIMTCDVKPDDPQLQSWLGEGLSIECHTIDHPCPILHGGDFAKAKSTYDRCVDLMGQIPNNTPVAFRTPCCDSLNTVSPRFYSEIFSSKTEKDNFLQIDSSVFMFYTSEDESLPKDRVLDANGKERFWKYLPKNNKYGGNTHDHFVNYIKNYPYPYVINNSCWQIPCIAPSDWSAQHLHGINNPMTVDDWKAAIDLTVHKQGCFSLVFHPHGWIKPEQVVEMIDHAVAKHGNKVKFLNFREVADRLNQRFFFSTKEMPHAYSVHSPADVVRFEDVDDNGFVDVIYPGAGAKVFDGKLIEDAGSLFYEWKNGQWEKQQFPFFITQSNPGALFQPKVRQKKVQHFASAPDGKTAFYESPESELWAHDEGPQGHDARIWRFGDTEPSALQVLEVGGAGASAKANSGRIRFELFVDIDGDGISESIGHSVDSDSKVKLTVFRQSKEQQNRGSVWESTPLQLPSKTSLSELLFADIDGNGLQDACIVGFGNITAYLTTSLEHPWKSPLSFESQIPGVLRYPAYLDGVPHVFNGGNGGVTNNGFFIHDRHFCWINEDTSKLPDLMYRVSFDEVLAAAQKKAESGERKAEESNPKSQTSNLKSDVTPTSFDPVPIGAAVIDITPDYPVRLTGYGNRLKESEGAAVRIHARAMVIGGESGKPKAESGESQNGTPNNASASAFHSPLSALITVDNCGVPLEMTEAVFERVAAKHNIARQNFAICSTHSHSAPWLRGFAPNIFAEVPDDHAAHLAQYEKELTDKLVEVVEKAIASQRPGHLSLGFGETGFAMNRRSLKEGKWVGFGEVPDGPTDKRVPVLAAHDTDGKLIAVLANYACHCTTETGEFNQISGDWAGFACDMLEADFPGAVALIAIGCGADANPSPRGTHEQAKGHGRTMADEVKRVISNVPDNGGDQPKAESGKPKADPDEALKTPGTDSPLSAFRSPLLRRIDPAIHGRIARIDLPLAPIPTRAEWEEAAKRPGVEGSRARYFLAMLEEGKEIPTTIPNYPVQTWCFGDDLAMVFLGGEVVVDYSIRMNDMFVSDRLWINAYSNDVPCYIASARLLREGGYECDSSMLYYRRPTRLAPEAEDLICDTVQKMLPHSFYSEALQKGFPAPKAPEDSLKCMTTRPDLRIVLAASEPLIRDPVAFDWDERGRLWVVEMGDYPGTESGERKAESGELQQGTTDNATAPAFGSPRSAFPRGRVRLLEDTDQNGVYDKATTFLDNLAFPNGIQCWRGGVIVTMAPEVFYAEDTNGDNVADVRKTLYRGFVEGNQQHRINGLRWGLDGWLYLANGDSGGVIEGTGTRWVDGILEESGERKAESGESQDTGTSAFGSPLSALAPVSLRGRDLRINPDTNELDAVSGQTQFGRERDDYGNWFGNNNSNPIYQFVLEDQYVRRNPHARISQVIAQVSSIPGAAPVYPTSRTLARFNDFAYANRFTSACSTMIYRDAYLGEQYYGNAFTSEPVHNLVSRLVLTRDGYGFKGERAADEQQSEFLASSDNWFRPTMVRTGPDGAIWVADMYRAVIEHPEWIPAEYQRKMNLYAGSDMGRIYRIVPAGECCGGKPTVGPACRAGLPPQADQQNGGSSNDDGPTSKASTTDESQQAAKSRPAGETYFSQPWNEIPVDELIQRLESSNGWWRDTAQRILTHRLTEITQDEALLLTLLGVHAAAPSPQSRVQTAALLETASASRADMQAEMLQSLAVQMQNDPEAEVRHYAVKLMEPLLRRGQVPEFALEILQTAARDSDSAVRLQVLLSLGECPDDSVAVLLSNTLHENADEATLRSAAWSSFTEANISRILNASLNRPSDQLNETLILQLVGEAVEMGQTREIDKPLRKLIGSIQENTTGDRYQVAYVLMQQLQKSDAMKALRVDSRFMNSVKQAVNISLQTVRNEETDERRRGIALRFCEAANQMFVAAPLDVSEFTTPQTPLVVQKAAVAILALRRSKQSMDQLVQLWSTLTPELRNTVIEIVDASDPDLIILLSAKDVVSVSDFNAAQRDGLLNHRNPAITKLAQALFGAETSTERSTIVADFKAQISSLKSEISRDEQIAAGKLVFEKRCSTCHRLQDIGKEVGADLAALKDRSTDSLLTAILDPNKAVEAKFLSYTAVSKEGLQYSGMLKGETGGSLTLIGSDGKEATIPRARIEELIGTKRSLMPEGLEKDLTVQDLANVISFVQSTGTPWKRFDGNSPRSIQPDADGTITLPAAAAEIYGPNLVFESKYGNLGFWTSTDDYAKWTFDVPTDGFWTVELDFACDDSTAGSLIRFSTGTRMLTARAPGTGTWDNYETYRAGTIDLHQGKGQLILTAPAQPPFALIDLKAVRLIPPEK